jgi:hypothetical protein
MTEADITPPPTNIRPKIEPTEVEAHPPTTQRTADPAPDPVEAARQRAADFVHNICTTAQLSLRERRDELDNAMERMKRSEDSLIHYISEFASFSVDVLKASAVMKDEITAFAKPFGGTPPSTITQLKNGKSDA